MTVEIRIKDDDSLEVTGNFDLVDADGNKYDLAGKPAFSLCRCGGSVNKPFCDGVHSRIGFQGAESAVRTEEQQKPKT